MIAVCKASILLLHCECCPMSACHNSPTQKQHNTQRMDQLLKNSEQEQYQELIYEVRAINKMIKIRDIELEDLKFRFSLIKKKMRISRSYSRIN